MSQELGLGDPYLLSRRWTERQLEVALAWLDEGWNRPDRTDHYLMQLGKLLVGIPALVWGKSPPRTSLDDFQINWGKKVKPVIDPNQPADWPKPVTKEQIERFNKARLLAQVTGAGAAGQPRQKVKGLPDHLQP